MAYPITRQFGPNAKGSELTFADMDNNLLYLDSKITGSSNYIPMYSGSTYLTSSVMYQLGGNIGIGTTSPSGKLQVVGGSITTAIADAYNTCATRFDLANPAISLGIGYVAADIPMLQGFNNLINVATDITINPFGGNVGIGTTTPNSKLEVVGSLRITGSVTSSNGMLVSNGGIIVGGGASFDGNVSIFESSLNLDGSGGLININDGELRVTGSASITDVLTLSPVSPLPSGKPTGSLAVSGSGANCKIYFFNGSWNALF